jgi:hypothetical protein
VLEEFPIEINCSLLSCCVAIKFHLEIEPSVHYNILVFLSLAQFCPLSLILLKIQFDIAGALKNYS